VNFDKDIAPVLPLWLETFGGIDPAVLDRLFNRALKTCRFFPKIAEILEPLQKAEETAVPQAAENAWEQVLDLRRLYWNPDIPGELSHRLAQLPERVQQAARAAGVFREFESVEGLHVWAKKRFIESFIAYGELERDQFLLPNGQIKNLLADLGQAKALPGPSRNWDECRAAGESYRARVATQGVPGLSPEERLRIADKLAAAARKVLEQPRERVVVVSDENRDALRRQAELIRARYPKTGNLTGIPPELRPVEAATNLNKFEFNDAEDGDK
jgi:hypothetical protein